MLEIKEIPGIPMRPEASVVLTFNKDTQHVAIGVRQDLTTNPVARYGVHGLEFLVYRGGDGPSSERNQWVHHLMSKNMPDGEVEALCLGILFLSGTFCPGQARTDFPEAFKSDFWTVLMDDIRRLLPVASVLAS